MSAKTTLTNFLSPAMLHACPGVGGVSDVTEGEAGALGIGAKGRGADTVGEVEAADVVGALLWPTCVPHLKQKWDSEGSSTRQSRQKGFTMMPQE